jgi:hypothetical protein
VAELVREPAGAGAGVKEGADALAKFLLLHIDAEKVLPSLTSPTSFAHLSLLLCFELIVALMAVTLLILQKVPE